MTRLGFGASGTRRVLGALVFCSIYAGAACGGTNPVDDIPPEEEAGAPGKDAQADGPGTDGNVSNDATTETDATTEDASVQDATNSDATNGDASNGDASNGDASNGDASDAGSDAFTESGVDASDGGANDASADVTQSDAAPDVITDAGSDVVEVDSGTDASTCPAPDVAGTERHLYVDKTVAVTGNGSFECPFKTILEATSAAKPPPNGSTLTIHVKGSGGTIYDEAAPIEIEARTTLTSAYPPGTAADPALVTVRAQGTCATSIKCVVKVTAGTVEGLTITDAAGAANVNGVYALANPKIVFSTIQNTGGSGILADLGGVEIGPGTYANGNANDGVRAVMPASAAGVTLKTVGGGRGNRFNSNGGSGVRVLDGIGTVDIDTAQANSNASNGFFISATPNTGTSHSLVFAEGNKNSVVGARVRYSGVTFKECAFDQNGIHGLYVGTGADDNTTTTFTSSEVRENGADGARFDTSGLVVIDGIFARDNAKNPGNLGGGSGVLLAAGTSAKVRNSVFLQNTVGVAFTQQRNGAGAALTTLDLGASASDLGGNTFGASSANNTKGGVCIIRSGVSGSQKAVGNAWSACPPTQSLIVGTNVDCYDAAAYADVIYLPNTAGNLNPVSTDGNAAPECKVGSP